MFCSFCHSLAAWIFKHSRTRQQFQACAAHKRVCETWQAKDARWEATEVQT